MKLNYTEVMRLPYHIQTAICHNSDDKRLQEAFSQCFTGEDGSHQIPWSYINREGHIGKDCFAAEGYEGGIPQYLKKMGVPYIRLDDEDIGQDHPVWAIASDSSKPFTPVLIEIKGQLLLIVSSVPGEYITYGIPASIIDFSK